MYSKVMGRTGRDGYGKEVVDMGGKEWTWQGRNGN